MNLTEALTKAIEGEAAAVYAYGLLGPYLTVDLQGSARSSISTHRQRELALRARLDAAGGDQPGAAVAYNPPVTVGNDVTAAQLAGIVEMRLAATYADLAAACTDTDRSDAVLIARECAVRAIGWGAPMNPFPGLD